MFYQLTTKLNAEELRRFAIHLQEDWQRDQHFTQFCEKVLGLLGPDRKQLLSGNELRQIVKYLIEALRNIFLRENSDNVHFMSIS